MNYFKRPWDEGRGDEYSSWGTSTWYFEIREDWYVIRQIEAYADGTLLRYDDKHLADKYGALTEKPFEGQEREELLPFAIGREEFEREWTRPAFNR